MKETRDGAGMGQLSRFDFYRARSIARRTSHAPIRAISSIASAMNQFARAIHEFEVADCVLNAVRAPAAQVTKRSEATGDFCDFRVTRIDQLNRGSF